MTYFSFRHSKLLLIILTCFYHFEASAAIKEYETTRLKSTAGAGVGSILMDEATILNPAPIAFFKVGSLYFNKGNSEINRINQAPSESDQMSVIVSDAKGKAAGSLSYQVQKSGIETKKRISAALSSLIKRKSAMGFALRKTTDEVIGSEKVDYLQTVVGVTHAVTPHFTIGFVAVDPLKKRVDDSMGTFGTQYVYKDFISVMADVGANYYQDLRETFVYKSALQFKIFDDFFARFGYFRDMGLEEDGTGVGLGWVQPKLVLEAALKNTRTFTNDKTSESSFSLSYRF